MEVILSKDVEKLGKTGTVIKVRDGYARNFLIPNHLAIPLTPGNLKKLEQEKEKKNAQLEKKKQEALELGERLSALSLTIASLVQEDEKLYGSISAQEIAQTLQEEGFEIDPNSILMEEKIHTLGIYEVPVKLHPEVLVKVKVWIVKK
jgi:large subunit ribosomal protein L9